MSNYSIFHHSLFATHFHLIIKITSNSKSIHNNFIDFISSCLRHCYMVFVFSPPAPTDKNELLQEFANKIIDLSFVFIF